MQDTIYAPSSAIGGAVAVVRLSGPECSAVVKKILSRDLTRTPHALRYVQVQEEGEVLDDCMAAYLPGPKTYTGEDMLELHCHGGSATVQALLACLSRCGLRPAEGGEFTRRAFMNGKMDLSSAEAVMDLIQSRAQGSRRAALEQLHGALMCRIRENEERLLTALSTLDAAMDYPEEMEAQAALEVPALVEAALEDIRQLIEAGRRDRVLREGLKVALVGRPNVGKSTLFNALTDAGVLAENMLFATLDPTARALKLPDGRQVMLIDTVGLVRRLPHLLVEAFRSTLEEAANADLILNVCDISAPDAAEQIAVSTGLLREIGAQTVPVLNVLNKCDRLSALPETIGRENCLVSAKTGMGLDLLLERIAAALAPTHTRMKVLIPYDQGAVAGEIRSRGTVYAEEFLPEGVLLDAMIDRSILAQCGKFLYQGK